MKWFVAITAVLSLLATLTAMMMDGYLDLTHVIPNLIAALTPKTRQLFIFDPKVLSQYQSVDEVIRDFPEELKSRHVLIMNSRSSQESTPQEPRVILFSEDGIVAFNRGNNIEFMTFSRKTRTVSLREIEFQGSTARLSGLNPAKCLGCHGQNPKPLFDQDALLSDEAAMAADEFKNRKGRYEILSHRSPQANAAFAELLSGLAPD